MSSKAKPKPCPVCRKAPSEEHRPFCGPGCKSRDLLKWLGEGYRIAGPTVDEQALDGVDSEGAAG